MTLLTDFHYKEAYEKGYQDGKTASTKFHGIHQGIIESLKQGYEIKLTKARKAAYEHGKKMGYNEGYKTGRNEAYEEGKQEGLALGRKERIEEILLPGELRCDAVARVKFREEGREELANHLLSIIQQAKEGSPIAIAIAITMEEAIQDFICSKV